jgi:hypothetical protein
MFERLKLAAEYAPLLGLLQKVTTAPDPHDKALAVVAAGKWLAGKSETTIDDDAVVLIEEALKSEKGKAAFNRILAAAGIEVKA